MLDENGVTYRAGLSFPHPLPVNWSVDDDAFLSERP
jgi:hypothetical protein